MPIYCTTWSGQAATFRVAAAPLGTPGTRLSRYTATFRNDASTCRADPDRTRQASSRNVTSRTW